MLNQGKEDGLEELVTETAQSFVNMAYKGEDAWDDFGERAWKSFRGGAMMGVGIGTAGVWATNKTKYHKTKETWCHLSRIRQRERVYDGLCKSSKRKQTTGKWSCRDSWHY